MTVIAIALALLVGLIVFLIANSDFGKSGKSTPKYDVPSVTGMPFAQAQGTLQTAGFTVARHDVDEPDQAADLVLGQDPESGRKIRKGGVINLQVSSPTIAMPDVVGQSRAQATQTLAGRNLTPNFTEEDSDQPPGTVLRTDPAAGGQVAKVPQGRPTVAVVVAREPLVPVPDVTTLDPPAALAALGQAGFQATEADTPSDTVPAGKVIGTDPAIGTPLAKGTAVKLLVSSGPTTIAMPNVVNAQRATAEQLLNGLLGLGVQVQLVNAGPAKRGLVIAQNPAPGTQVPKGTTVAITVGA